MLELTHQILTGVINASGHEGGAFPLTHLVIQYINLAILVGALGWFLKDKIPATIKQRRSDIESRVNESERLSEQAKSHHQRSKERLDRLDQELKDLKQQFVQEAQIDRQEILDQAKASAERIKQEAKIAIRVEFDRAVHELRQQTARDSVDQARASLKEKVDSTIQRRLVEKGLHGIRDGDTA